MYWFRRLLLWLSPARRKARAQELEEELKANLQFALDDGPDARREFGNLTHARENVRAVWFPGWDPISQDLRYAFRSLRASPVFTSVAILSLALGIGAASALFSIVDTVVLKPLSYRQPGELVFVREVVPPLAHIYPSLPVNIQHFRFWRNQVRSFGSLAAVSSTNMTLTG